MEGLEIDHIETDSHTLGFSDIWSYVLNYMPGHKESQRQESFDGIEEIQEEQPLGMAKGIYFKFKKQTEDGKKLRKSYL